MGMRPRFERGYQGHSQRRKHDRRAPHASF
jgi:hypothetical protein